MEVKRRNRLAGYFCLALAAVIIVSAWMDPSVQPQRVWLMVAAAAVFFVAGIQLMTGVKGRFSGVLAAISCTILSAVGFSVAFTSEPVEVGLPLIPAAWNQDVGHVLFGIGALITAATAIYFFVTAFRPGKRIQTRESPE